MKPALKKLQSSYSPSGKEVETAGADHSGRGGPRRAYHAPLLSRFGELRNLVLGASGANPESGGLYFK